jgi:hypothetical protein
MPPRIAHQNVKETRKLAAAGEGIRGSIPLLVGKPGWSVPVLPLRQRRYPSRKLTVGVRVKA